MAVIVSGGVDVDWAALQDEIRGMQEYCLPYKVASDEDIELCKLSDMTFNMIDCDLIDDWRRGDLVVSLDKDKRERLIDVAYVLGFSEDDSCTSQQLTGSGRPNWRHLNDLVIRRQINNEFLGLYGLLHRYSCFYAEIYLGNEQLYRREFHQCMMAIGGATLIQRHWYAHWLTAAAEKRSQDPDVARRDLTQIIEGIGSKKIKPWGPYGRDWYECMLETTKVPGSSIKRSTGDLKTSYTKLSNAEIGRMVEHPHITVRVLPPLAADLFERL